MKCWQKGCEAEGTIPDPESPAVFVNPEKPDGPRVKPVHCRLHHEVIMRRRDENEASFDRMVGRWPR